MKKFTYLIYFLGLLSFNVVAEESATSDTVVVFNGETIKGAYYAKHGTLVETTENPLKDGLNTTDSVMMVSRIDGNTNWYSTIGPEITPDTVELGTTIIEAMVMSSEEIDCRLRLNINNAWKDFLPEENYSAIGEWQVLRYDISSVPVGASFAHVLFLPDCKAKLSSLKFAYIDELKIIFTPLAIPDTVNAELCNFESTETAVPSFGATASRELNPQKDNNNGSDSCLQIGRTGANFYELIDISIDDFYVPTSEKCYVHLMVKSSVELDISLRPNKDGSPDIRARSPYTGDGEWQDLVFDLAKYRDAGYKMSNLRFLTDIAMALDNDSTFAYFDEIIVNEDITPRIESVSIPETIDSTFFTFEEEGGILCSPAYGAIVSKVANPDNSENSLNQTDSCLKLGDNVVEQWALVDFEVDLFTPKSACYLHAMVKSNVSPNISLRTMLDNATDIMPMDSLSPNNEWQDLVFDIGSAQGAGYNVKGFRIMLDFKEDNLNSTTNLMYLDEIIISADSTARVKEASSMLRNNAHSNVNIYPNPTSSQLYISGEGVKFVIILNVSGQEVLRSETLENGIDISMLNSGIYIVKCHNDQGKMIAIDRVIKK